MKRAVRLLALFLILCLLSGCSFINELITALPETTDAHLPGRLVVQIDIDVYPDQPGTSRRYMQRENVETLISMLRSMEDGDVPESDTTVWDSYSYYTIRTTGANGSSQVYYLLNRRLFRSSEGTWCTVSAQEVDAFEAFITATFTDCVVESES